MYDRSFALKSSYVSELIHAVYKLIRSKDSAIPNVISRREPHWIRMSTLSTSGRVTVSFKYWQLHSTGRRRYSSYRRFLSRTADRYLGRAGWDVTAALHCRECALSFVREVIHFCANVRACRSDFMITLVG